MGRSEKIAVFDYIPKLKWIVAASAYLDEFYASVIKARKYALVGVAGIAWSLSLLVIYFVTLKILTPITIFTKVMEKNKGQRILEAWLYLRKI